VSVAPERSGCRDRSPLAAASLTRFVVGGLLSILLGSGLILPAAPPTQAATPTYAQLIGQKLMVAMSGTTPGADLLARVTAGQVGGVILFGSNVTSASQLTALTTKLRQAAAAGGQPPLLIATDQEGGSVKRVSWAPPTLSPPQMGALSGASTAYSQGKATGVVLGCAGINNDLAPVADVPSSTSSFMYQQGRTWSFSASVTATQSDAFASGLEAGHDIPAMKHFPGIGMATRNTDTNVVTITASKSALAPGLLPYQKAIGHRIPLIMLSNAAYPAYDSANAAGWSHAISVGLLRTTLGFTGVTITDSLNGAAAARGVSVTSLAVKAARAGTDMILLSGSEASTRSTYASLLLDAQNGTIPLSTLQTSYYRVLALKAGVTNPAPDTTAPTVKPPVSHLYAVSKLSTTTSPVRTNWSATDTCGISRYTLERRVNGGSWAGQTLGTGTSTSIKQSLSFGSTYRYVVKATDGAGNTSGWAYGPSFKALLTQQSGSGATYHGTWHTVSNTYASGGSLAYSTASGASATFKFTGYAVSWVAYRGPNRGSAAIYVDGVYTKSVNLYSATYYARQIVYAINWAGNGAHTMTIVNLGTSGHPRIDIDAFVRLYAS
jgi:beta-N-acetylhexosaminidase